MMPPLTSPGVKIIDIWMLFSLFLPFLDVLIQTWINVGLQSMQEDLQMIRHDEERSSRQRVKIAVGAQLVAVRPLRGIGPEEVQKR
jgi:hypothetical protein